MFTLTCTGPITVDAAGVPACLDGWQVEEYSQFMTAAEFGELWPQILLLFVLAVGIRYVRSVFEWGPNRN